MQQCAEAVPAVVSFLLVSRREHAMPFFGQTTSCVKLWPVENIAELVSCPLEAVPESFERCPCPASKSDGGEKSLRCEGAEL